jgi:acetyltransferase-like isoleucine patch superfamily enzyme
MLAANVSLISNNHDLYDRAVLLCKPVKVCKGAWIGAGAMIMPGVRVGRYAVVGAGAIVTKDVEDYQVVVGNPARPIKTLDKKRFGE